MNISPQQNKLVFLMGAIGDIADVVRQIDQYLIIELNSVILF